MLTKLEIRNFKRFDSVEIELGNPVVFIGPNNSGKTTALQALALWGLALTKWLERAGDIAAREPESWLALNRKDLVAVPVPDSSMLWRDLRLSQTRMLRFYGQEPHDAPLSIPIGLKVTADAGWQCAFEFKHANQESLYCKPAWSGPSNVSLPFPVPLEALDIRMAFLPPMSGLADQEFLKQPGEISYLIGQGRTGEVLRNLCYRVRSDSPDGEERWDRIAKAMQALFGLSISQPSLSPSRASIDLSYRDRQDVELDISCTGRGALQTLLLLAYLQVNPGSVLLLDEPDAHLEVLRQQDIYRTLSEAVSQNNSQVIIASHSEVILREAAKDTIVAFVGKPHRMNDKSQVLKALERIGFDQYYEAEVRGWVLYLEGSTDLSVLRAFAEKLRHPVVEQLARPFVSYIGNQPNKAYDHFFGLVEAKRDLTAFLLCDHFEGEFQPKLQIDQRMWRRREIENYLCQPGTLYAYAESLEGDAATHRELMKRCVQRLVPPVALEDSKDRWWSDTKASDAFLDRLFEMFFKELGTSNGLFKTSYYHLARFVRVEDIDPEVTEVLDAIYAVSQAAHPRT